MPRNTLPPPTDLDGYAGTVIELMDEDRSTELRVREAELEIQERAMAVADQVGYDGPLTTEAVDDGIRLYQRRTVEDCLELGRRLLVRKELTPHGEWVDTLARLGFTTRTAQKFMQAAIKTGKSAVTALLASRSPSATHYLELLTLDDDNLEALADGGTVAGLTLDDIDRMSSSALRAALREARENETAQGRILAEKNERLDALAAKVTKAERRRIAEIETATPDQIRADLMQEVSRRAFAAEAAIRGDLRLGVEALQHHATTTGESVEQYLAGVLGQLTVAIEAVREQYGIRSTPDGEIRPEWLTDPAMQEELARIDAQFLTPSDPESIN